MYVLANSHVPIPLPTCREPLTSCPENWRLAGLASIRRVTDLSLETVTNLAFESDPISTVTAPTRAQSGVLAKTLSIFSTLRTIKITWYDTTNSFLREPIQTPSWQTELTSWRL